MFYFNVPLLIPVSVLLLVFVYARMSCQLLLLLSELVGRFFLHLSAGT
jgi:hypothetical protein